MQYWPKSCIFNFFIVIANILILNGYLNSLVLRRLVISRVKINISLKVSTFSLRLLVAILFLH